MLFLFAKDVKICSVRNVASFCDCGLHTAGEGAASVYNVGGATRSSGWSHVSAYPPHSAALLTLQFISGHKRIIK